MAETIGYERNSKLRKTLSREMQEKLRSAHDRLILGQNYRQMVREEQWRDSYTQYMGDRKWRHSPDDDTADLVNVNISFSTINTLVPFVADENPKFLVSPESGDANVGHAGLLEVYLNRLWRSKEFEGQVYISQGTFDYLLYGDGYLKAGYDIVTKPVYDNLGDLITDRIQVAKFFVTNISPWDIWLDPYSDGLHNARWVCQRIIIPADELNSDKRYKISEELQAEALDDRHQAPETRRRLEETQNMVTIYEFYDLVEGWMLTFTADGSQAIRYVEHIVCPIVQLRNYRIPNSPYHMGELEQVSSLQDELNKTRSQMITHRRRNNLKWVVNENRLTDDAIEAMKSSRINDVIRINTNEPLANVINAIIPQPLTADSYQIEAQIRADINEITGVNEYLRGFPQGISRTATEATILEGATNIRTRHKLLQIETAARQLGQLLLDIMRDVLPLTDFEEMSMYVTGHEAEKLNRLAGAESLQTDLILTPTREIFEGRYIVEVERGSTELRNPQIKSQKLKEIATILMNSMPLLAQFGIPINIQYVLREWLEAEGIDDVDAVFEIGQEQELMQQAQMIAQLQASLGGAGGALGAQPATGSPTAPGEPRSQTTGPPTEAINERNSGILAPRY